MKLYKYMSFNEDLDDEKSRDIHKNKMLNICNCKVRFSQVKRFNDKFEGRWSGKIDYLGPEKLREILVKEKKRDAWEYCFSPISTMVDLSAPFPADTFNPRDFPGIFDDSNKHEYKMSYLKEIQKQIDEITLTIGVLCLSSSNDSQLMWSHYAGNENGVCIEYDAQNPFFLDKVQPVSYSKERHSLDPLFSNWEEYSHFDKVKELKSWIREGLYKKADCWGYENEYRMITDLKMEDSDIGYVDVELPREAITGIYYGSELNAHSEAELQCMFTRYFGTRCNRYKMVQKKDTFEYEAVKL